MKIKAALLTISFFFAGCLCAYAQMSDDAVLDYVTRGIAEGKSQSAIGNELLARGVSVAQAKRIMQKYNSGGLDGEKKGTGSSDYSGSAGDTRLREKQNGSGFGLSDSNDGNMPASVERYDEKGQINPLGMYDKYGNPLPKGFDADQTAEEEIDEQSAVVDDIYGHSLFSSQVLSFEPNENVATPAGYVLGPGDEVIVDVWGENETTIRQTISPDGQIVLEHYGPVTLSGVTVEAATAKIKKILSAGYSLSGSNPSSSLNVTLGKIRTIRVSVLGEVKVPGTFRLSSLSTALNALYRAGGVTEIGTLRKIKVLRGDSIAAEVDVYDMLFHGRLKSVDVALCDGDVVIVQPCGNVVEIAGGVRRPMRYELTDSETLADLLYYAGDFSSNANKGEVLVQRLNGNNFQVKSVKSADFASFHMMDGDEVSVRVNLRTDVVLNRVEVEGSVFFPGQFELGDGLSTVSQLVARAGGLLEDTYKVRAQLKREKEDRSLEILSIPLGAILDGSAPDVELRRNDVLVVTDVGAMDKKGVINLTGYVTNPGDYDYAEGMTVEDIIMLAGGLEAGASEVRVEVSRRIIDPKSHNALDSLARIYYCDIKNGFRIDGKTDFFLEPFDVVAVRKSPVYVKQRRVTVTGEATFPGEYVLSMSDERLSDIFARMGGVTPNAYLHGAMIKRRPTQNELDTHRMLKQVSAGRDSISNIGLVDSISMEVRYAIGISLDEAIKDPKGDEDLVLQDGDELVIPALTNTVRVQGAVLYPNTVGYIPGQRARYYVNQSGGFTNDARKARIYVVYMNGKVAVGGGAPIEPGCEIIVPTKPERRKLTPGEWLGIGTSAASIATMVATLASTIRTFAK